MPSSPMPGTIRRRSEKLHKRGPKPAKKPPTAETNRHRVVMALLLITLGSALYQIIHPLFGGQKSSKPAATSKTEADLTREQQAQAAQAILQQMNRKAAEKYMKTAKDYRPPEEEAAAAAEAKVADGDYDEDDDGVQQPLF